MIRLFKTSAAVLAIALVAVLFAAGCGGGDTTSTPATPATTAGASGAAGATNAAASSTQTPESLIGQVITPTDRSPKEFQTAISNRRPVVVTFYMTGPADDSQVRTAVTALESRYKGQVDFFDYQYTDGSRYGDLTRLLKVNTTPAVIVINKQGKVQEAWSGYVDQKSIEQGIVEAIGS